MSVHDHTLVEIRRFHHNGTRNIVTLLSSLTSQSDVFFTAIDACVDQSASEIRQKSVIKILSRISVGGISMVSVCLSSSVQW